MKEKTLDNSNTADAKTRPGGFKLVGNPDVWRLLCKASSEDEGWMKSTKVMEVKDPRSYRVALGCLVQVTTQQRNNAGSYAVSEALTFVPGATFESFGFQENA